MSPGVQLPALSNLDVNSNNGVYGVYFLRAGEYDVVGFRLAVQTVVRWPGRGNRRQRHEP